MFKQFASLSAAALLTAGLSAPASAAFINGSISFSDGLLNLGGIVSDLTAFSIGTPTISNGSVGDFAGLNGQVVTTQDFDTAAPSGDIYAVGGYTFTLTTVANITAVPLACLQGLCADEIGFNIAGTVAGNGFDTTAFIGSWTANGSCAGQGGQGNATCTSEPTGSWSASVTALGRDVPAPATVALLGLGLAGLGLARRKKA